MNTDNIGNYLTKSTFLSKTFSGWDITRTRLQIVNVFLVVQKVLIVYVSIVDKRKKKVLISDNR